MDIQRMIKPVIDVKDTFVPNSEQGWVPMDEEVLQGYFGWEQVEGIRKLAAA